MDCSLGWCWSSTGGGSGNVFGQSDLNNKWALRHDFLVNSISGLDLGILVLQFNKSKPLLRPLRLMTT